ncbi:MAG: hypothetical protein L0956_03045 [Candidatus Mariimomonas ferrooxydans]
MKDILTILRLVEKLEESLSNLYDWLSNKFSDNQEARSFFNQLSFEENSHRNLVSYQIRVARQNKDLFADVEADVEGIKNALEKIKLIMDNSSLSFEDAVRLTVEIESTLAEQYAVILMKQSIKEFSKLIDSLGSGFKEHHNNLKKMANKYNIVFYKL